MVLSLPLLLSPYILPAHAFYTVVLNLYTTGTFNSSVINCVISQARFYQEKRINGVILLSTKTALTH